MVLSRFRAVLVGTWWYLVSIGSYWLVLGLVVLGQYRAVLVIMGQDGAVLAGTWWYLVSMGHYWLVLGGTGSV